MEAHAPGNSSSRRRWLIVSAILSASLVLFVASTALFIQHGATIRAQARPNILPSIALSPSLNTPTDIPTAPPTPTPTPDLVGLHRSIQGCANGVPPTYPSIITDGHLPGTKLPIPNEVALTFDDGPTPYSTPKVLDALESGHIPATFFVEGQYVMAYPYLLRREWKDGFAIGAHSWDHPNMIFQTDDGMRHQFGDTIQAIEQTIPSLCVWFWRPPYGTYNGRILLTANMYGLSSINWSSAGLDWTLPGVNQIANNVLNSAHPGAIILLHDGPAVREQTAAAIPLIAQGLISRGYKLVTIPQLLADGGFPGISTAPIPPPTPTPRPDSCDSKSGKPQPCN